MTLYVPSWATNAVCEWSGDIAKANWSELGRIDPLHGLTVTNLQDGVKFYRVRSP